MQTSLNLAQILVSIALVIAIILQVKGTGAGVFGQAQATFRTRRGVEKLLFQFTIGLSVLFIVLAILSVQVQ